jgi:dihydrofolate reductase
MSPRVRGRLPYDQTRYEETRVAQKLRVNNMSMSLDGYVAGPDQSLENPLGIGAPPLHEWIFTTRGGRAMIGQEGGDTGVNEDFFQRGVHGVGATIMGRNMFGPVRGPWPDEQWRGWWGEEPPFHHPVFVLTHHQRPSLEMQGGTTFHFITDGIESALSQALAAADGQDVRLGGGADTVRQYVRARLLDELHVAVVPTLLGGGERLLDDLDGAGSDYECVEHVAATGVTHVVLARKR